MDMVKLRVKTLPDKLGYLTLSAELKRVAASEHDQAPVFHYQEPLSVRLEAGTIIGYESTEESVPFTFGYITGSKLVINQLLSNHHPSLEALIAKQIPTLPHPYISYNVDFVTEISRRAGVLIREDQWLELQQPVPYIDDHGRWQSFSDALMKKEYYISSPLIDFGKGKEVPDLWRSFITITNTRDRCKLLYSIIRHLRQSLLKELMLVMALEWPSELGVGN